MLESYQEFNLLNKSGVTISYKIVFPLNIRLTCCPELYVISISSEEEKLMRYNLNNA